MDMAGLGLGDVVPNMSIVERLKDVHAILRKTVGRIEPPTFRMYYPAQARREIVPKRRFQADEPARSETLAFSV